MQVRKTSDEFSSVSMTLQEELEGILAPADGNAHYFVYQVWIDDRRLVSCDGLDAITKEIERMGRTVENVSFGSVKAGTGSNLQIMVEYR